MANKKAHEEQSNGKDITLMKKMRRAQLHRVRIQYWKDTAKEASKNKLVNDSLN
ncbi:hypothetical protein [Vibrio fortis]|uniref:hypothetical protein n=1 Tax=Vibrio fortis TaxID=212667 RepID=UPI001CD9585B|nr:hypothetical protein [Vibrio fortis]